MKSFLGKYSDLLFGVLRVVAALMFLAHGLQKLNVAMLGGFTPPPELPQLTVAAWIESIGGSLLILGLGTRYVAFILSGEMAVAYFIAHFPRGTYPAMNGGDAAILFCFIFLYLAAAGPGSFAVNGK